MYVIFMGDLFCRAPRIAMYYRDAIGGLFVHRRPRSGGRETGFLALILSRGPG